MEYYIQRHASGTVGNCVLFWKNNDHGYTCDLEEARVFSQSEMEQIIGRDIDNKYRAWPKEYLDGIAQKHVNCQDLDRQKFVSN
jgi:hypothetical protein